MSLSQGWGFLTIQTASVVRSTLFSMAKSRCCWSGIKTAALSRKRPYRDEITASRSPLYWFIRKNHWWIMPEDTRLSVAVIQKAVGRKAVTLSNVVTSKITTWLTTEMGFRHRIDTIVSKWQKTPMRLKNKYPRQESQVLKHGEKFIGQQWATEGQTLFHS